MSCSYREVCLVVAGLKKCVDKTRVLCVNDFSCNLIEENGLKFYCSCSDEINGDSEVCYAEENKYCKAYTLTAQ